ncbi:MAG: tyrosine recombinase [Proteobacteria bacterium]|nr:tyrosine recombinase [Pseudomonadota bacterium]
MQQYLELFLEMLVSERGLSAHTLESYKSDLKDFFLFLMDRHGEERSDDAIQEKDGRASLAMTDFISTACIEAYLKILHEKNIKISTILRRFSALKQFCQFLVGENIIDYDPTKTLTLPKKDLTLPKTLEEHDIAILLENASKLITPEGIRLYAMLEVLYATGLRVSELVTLSLPNIQGKEIANKLLICGKGNKERIVLLTPQAKEALKNYLNIRSFFVKQAGSQGEKWLFPSKSQSGHLTRQRFGQLLKILALECHLDPEKVSPHVIRHAFATHLLKNGANLMVIQKLLGHADISTTQVYTHIVDQQLHDLIFNHHPLAKR